MEALALFAHRALAGGLLFYSQTTSRETKSLTCVSTLHCAPHEDEAQLDRLLAKDRPNQRDGIFVAQS